LPTIKIGRTKKRGKCAPKPLGSIAPFAKTIQVEDGTSRTEIRLNVSKTNILRPANRDDQDATNFFDHEEEEDQYQTSIDDFSVDSDDFE
jgi:hypothetical protein